PGATASYCEPVDLFGALCLTVHASFLPWHLAPGPALTDWPADLPEHAHYRACGLVSEETVALPPWESVLIDDLNLDREQLEAYQNVLERTSGDDAWSSRGLLGGYPDQIQ